MADKTTGELQSVKIEDLPNSIDIYDDFKMPGELQGEAVHVTGSQLKIYAQESTKSYAAAAELSASYASEYAASSQSAFQGVKDAIDNLPDGATVVINDLTTGGKTAALSAEMGRQLEQSKVPAITVYYTEAMNADDLAVPVALIRINSSSNAELYAAFDKVETYAYVHTIFFTKVSAGVSHVQIAYSYKNAPAKMAIRTYNANSLTWTPWRAIAGTDYAVNKSGDTMTGNLTIARANPDIRLNDSAIGNEVSMVGAGNTLILRNYNTDSSGIRRQVELRNSDRESSIATALKLWDVTADGTVGYDILHTGNKPTGSYQGTSSTERQDIDTKGIGSCIYIHGGTLGAIVGKSGGLGWDTNGGTIHTLTYAAAHFIDGVLTIATNSFYVNSSDVTYTYQVL